MPNYQYSSDGKQENPSMWYTTMDNIIESLKNNLDDPTQLDMASYVSQIEELLNVLHNIPDREPLKKTKIEMIAYQIIYDYMKLESIVGDKNTILKKVREGLIPTANLAKFIYEDMKILSPYEVEIFLPIKEKIEQDGINREELVNEELIYFLAMATKGKFIKERWQQAMQMYAEYISEKEKIKPATRELREAKEDYKKAAKQAHSFLPGIIARFTLYALPILGAGFIIRDFHKDALEELNEPSRGIVKTYNSQNNSYEVRFEYDVLDKDLILVEEIMPWEKDAVEDSYHRTKNTYIMKKKKFDSYPDIETAISTTKGKTEEEILDYLPADFDYQKTSYVVKYTEFKSGPDIVEIVIVYSGLYIMILLMSFIVSLTMEMILLFITNPIEQVLEEYKEAIDYQNKEREYLQAKTKELEEIMHQCKEKLEEIVKNPNSFIIKGKIGEEQKEIVKK